MNTADPLPEGFEIVALGLGLGAEASLGDVMDRMLAVNSCANLAYELVVENVALRAIPRSKPCSRRRRRVVKACR